MGKTGKVIGGVVLLLLIAVGVGVYWVLNNLDHIVEAAIEKVGPQVTGTPVSVGSVGISLSDGAGEIRGLVIGNPPGFGSDHAFKLDRIALAIDTKTITSDVVRIRQVLVDGADLIAEVKVGEGINLAKIADNLKSGSGGGGESADSGGGPKIVIEKFDFTNASMTLVSPVTEDKTQRLGDIHVKNIGEGSGGATAAEAGAQLLEPVIRSAVRAAREQAGDLGIEGYREGAVEKLQEILKIDPQVERDQRSRLAELRRDRSASDHAAALEALRSAAEGSENLIPRMLDAVRAQATVGEVCQALVPVFGIYREVSVI